MQEDEETQPRFVSGVDLDHILSLLSSARDANSFTRLLSDLSFESFLAPSNETERRLDKLVELCRRTDIEDRSRGELVVAATTVFLCARVNESFPSIFDALVRTLWGVVSDGNVNDFKSRTLRATACECLTEVELCIPGALAALVKPKSDATDGKSLLERLVVEERTSAFQSYLKLFLTILASPSEEGTPSEEVKRNVTQAVALALESLTMCSKWARVNIHQLMFNGLQRHQPDALAILAARAMTTLAHGSPALTLPLLAETIQNSTDAKTFMIFDDKVAGVASDLSARSETRQLALEIRLRQDLPFKWSKTLPGAFDSLELATLSARACLVQVHRMISGETLMSVPSDLLSTVIWFAEDFWRENPCGELTTAAYSVIGEFIRLFPQEHNQVTEIMVHFATLRGGPRLFHPLERIINWGESSIAAMKAVDQVLERVGDAVADVPNEKSISGFFSVIQIVLASSIDELPSKQILNALERFAKTEALTSMRNSSDFVEQFDEIAGYLDCLRLCFLKSRNDFRVFRFCLRLVENITENIKDPIVKDECLMLIGTAQMYRAGHVGVERLLRQCGNNLARKRLDDKPIETQTRKVVGPLRKKTTAMEKLVSVKRSPITSVDGQADAMLTIPIDIEWLGGDAIGDVLYALEIHVIKSHATNLRELPKPIIVPALSSRSAKHSTSFILHPKFPSPMRLSLRAMATDREGRMVEGGLPDLVIDFKDYFCEAPNGVLANLHLNSGSRVVIVKEKITSERFASFFAKVFGRFVLKEASSLTNGEGKVRQAYLVVKPGHWMFVAGSFDAESKACTFRVTVSHWAVLSFVEELFRSI